MGMDIKFQMGMKSFKCEGIGTKNLFPHTSIPVVHAGMDDRQIDTVTSDCLTWAMSVMDYTKRAQDLSLLKFW